MTRSPRILPEEINPQSEWPTKYLVNTASGCWIFQGTAFIYGRARYKGRVEYAHRLFYRLHIGDIPDGMTVDHVYDRGCVSKLCVNPDHLELVTNAENASRARRMGSTCGAGLHPWPESSRSFSSGARYCAPCRAARARKYRLEARLAA